MNASVVVFVVFDALLARSVRACVSAKLVKFRLDLYRTDIFGGECEVERGDLSVLHSNSDQTNFMLLCMENFTAVCSTCTRCDGTVFSGTIVFTFKNAYRTIFLCHIE